MNIHPSRKLNNSMATRVAFNGSFDIIRIGLSTTGPWIRPTPPFYW